MWTPAATIDDLDDQIAEFLYEVRTPAATIDDLDDQIAEFLYGCSLPFSIVEHPLFKSLVSSLRPGYQSPSRQAVSNQLLDKCHDKYQAVMKQLLNNKTITMQQDGWSSVQNDPVIATSVVSDGKGYFVDAKDTGTTIRLQRPVRLCSRTLSLMLTLPMGVRYSLLSKTMLRAWTRCTESWRRRTRT